MSGIELKILLEQATRAPVEKLGTGDIARLISLLRHTLGKLEAIVQKETVLKIENSVPPEDLDLYRALKKVELKSTKDHAAAARRAEEECRAIAPPLRTALKKIRQSEASESLAIVEALSKQEKEWLSLLANVSDANGKMIKYSPRNRTAWFAGIGIKASGFEKAKRARNRKQ